MVYFQWLHMLKSLPIKWMPASLSKRLDEVSSALALDKASSAWGVLTGNVASLDCLFEGWGRWQKNEQGEIATNVLMRAVARCVLRHPVLLLGMFQKVGRGGRTAAASRCHCAIHLLWMLGAASATEMRCSVCWLAGNVSASCSLLPRVVSSRFAKPEELGRRRQADTKNACVGGGLTCPPLCHSRSSMTDPSFSPAALQCCHHSNCLHPVCGYLASCLVSRSSVASQAPTGADRSGQVRSQDGFQRWNAVRPATS